MLNGVCDNVEHPTIILVIIVALLTFDHDPDARVRTQQHTNLNK